MEGSVAIDKKHLELIVRWIVDGRHGRAGGRESLRTQLKWRIPCTVLRLPEESERTVRIDYKNFKLIVEWVKDGGHRSARAAKPGGGEPKGPVPNAVLCFPNKRKGALSVYEKHFQLIVGRVVNGGDRSG